MNRWRSLVLFNVFLVGLVLAVHLAVAPLEPGRGRGLAAIFLMVNGWLLVARAVSFWSLERHLPPRSASPDFPRGVG